MCKLKFYINIKIAFIGIIILSYFITDIKCINEENFFSFLDNEADFKQKTEYVEKSDDLNYQNKERIYFRNKKANNINFSSLNVTNNEEEAVSNNTKQNKDMNVLSEDYPLCETKYKIVDKLKKFKIFSNLIKKRKTILSNSCIMESYAFIFVTIKNTDDFFLVLATVYGYGELFLSILIFIYFFATFNQTLLYFIFIIPTHIIINDLILKNIIKMERPENSALRSYGMPSGHSSLSLSLFTFIVLHLNESYKNIWNITASILAFITLIPVPWSRVYIEDHTISQVIAGSFVGMLIGSSFYFLRILFPKNGKEVL